MGAFGGLTLTNRGKILQSKAQSGVQLKYTRMGIGDGNLGTSSILNLNALIHEVKSLNLTKLKTLGDGKAVVGAVLSNQDLTEGFYFREIGIFATDPDVGEILYCYGNSGGLAEYIPAGGTDTIEKNIDVQTIVGNATNVTAVIDSSLVWETAEGAQEKANQAEANAKDYTNTKFSQVKYPVTSVNNKTGAINLTAADVGAAPSSHTHPASIIIQDTNNRFVSDTEKANWNAKASTAVATTTANGLMSSTDKSKLDGIANNANNYVHPTGDGNQHVPATGTGNNKKVLKAGATAGSAAWGNVDWSELTGKPSTFTPSGHNHPISEVTNLQQTLDGKANAADLAAHQAEYATQSKSGHMSAADKSKLDGIQSGAQTNQNAFSNVKVGATTIAADNATDTLELVAGLNIALTPDDTNDKVTISTNAEVNQNAFSNIKIGTSTISANSKTDTLEFAPGNGIALSSDTTNDKVTISANFAGTGSAPTVSRSDHNHDTTYAKISDAQMVKLTQDDGAPQTIPDNTDITTFGGTGFFIGKNLVGMPNNDQSVYRFIINPSGPTTRTIIAVRSGNETYIASVNSGVWSGWEKVLTDKAASWVTLSLQNGIMPYQSGQNLQCCKVGNIVFIRGVMKGITGQAVIATLPAGYRPVSMPHSFSMPSSANRHARYTIGLNGDLSIENMSDNNFNSAYWYPVMTSYIAD